MEPNWNDIMKYDGRFPEPAYITGDSLAELAAERDRLAAENAELKRRCDAIVKFALQTKEDSCYCDDNPPTCEYCLDACALIAIAEGRDNG